MKNRKSTTIILVIIFLVGLCVLLYPTVSDYVNSKSAIKSIVYYDESISQMEEKERKEMLQAAKDYNEKISKNPNQFVNGEAQDEEYKSLLNVDGNGMMGYITINKLGVYLPIYHGTGEDALIHSTGHIEGSSLPIGGESTHALISGHRGLPSAKLFTDLDELEIGDTFKITVLDEVTTYEVDQIRIVLPNEVSDLKLVEGEDYVTLITCTPYGVNSHRLLVRGHRIANTGDDARVTADALQIDTKIVALFIAVPILIVLLFWLLIHYRKKDKNKKQI